MWKCLCIVLRVSTRGIISARTTGTARDRPACSWVRTRIDSPMGHWDLGLPCTPATILLYPNRWTWTSTISAIRTRTTRWRAIRRATINTSSITISRRRWSRHRRWGVYRQWWTWILAQRTPIIIPLTRTFTTIPTAVWTWKMANSYTSNRSRSMAAWISMKMV